MLCQALELGKRIKISEMMAPNIVVKPVPSSNMLPYISLIRSEIQGFAEALEKDSDAVDLLFVNKRPSIFREFKLIGKPEKTERRRRKSNPLQTASTKVASSCTTRQCSLRR